ncbi:hypothetical protein [Aeromonas sp. Marseille-Q7275]
MKNPPITIVVAAAIIGLFGGDKATASTAFSLSGIIKQAEVIKVNAVTAATNTAISVSTTIRGFAANDPYQIKKLDVPKATYMTRFKAGMGETGGLKGLVKRNAWYAAWAASIAAAGWAIDELTDQVTNKPKNYTGNCQTTSGSYGTKTFEQCISIALGVAYPVFQKLEYYSGVDTLTIGQMSGYRVYGCNTASPPVCTSRDKMYFTPISFSYGTAQPVPDDALYDSLVTQMLNDPEDAAQAFMVPDPWPYPYPEVFPDTVPYIPGVTQSDQELLDLYAQGLLQSTNPNAAHYVSPEKLAEIAALAGQLQEGATPEGQVAAANDQLKKPLTQKELEESLKKEREAEEKATKESLGQQPVLTTLLDPYKQFEDGVKATPNDQINALPQNNFIIGGTGQCYVINKTFSIMGQSITISTYNVCEEFYYPYFLPILTWFFYISTGVYVWFTMRDAFSRRF